MTKSQPVAQRRDAFACLRRAFQACGVTALLALSQSAFGLGLGELDLQSALNERFKGQIELFDASGLEGSEIRVSLASAEDFDRVGVERFFFLTTLKFEVETVGGRPVIRVRSTQPISEPYLNFLVEVLWPSGRLLKEFTVLLDPPTFTQAAAPEVVAPSRDRADTEVSGAVDRGQVNVPAQRSAGRAAPRQGASGPDRLSSSRNSDGTYGATTRNDTLWKIASDTLPSNEVTVQQNMLALKRLNPEAFINDNINLLKAGYVLRTPSTADANAMTAEQAKQRVTQENEAWRTGRSLPEAQTQVADSGTAEPALKAQVDATRDAAPKAAAPAADDGQLRIVAEAGDSAQGATDSDGEGTAAAEEADRLNRELEAVEYERDREREIAADQLAVKDRQLEVKDQEIAQLQAELKQVRETMQELSAQRAQNQSVSQPTSATAWWQSPTVLGAGVGALVLLSVGGLIMGRRRRAAAEADYYAEQMESAELAAGGRAEPEFSALAEAEASEPATVQEDDWDAAEDRSEDETFEVEPDTAPDTAIHSTAPTTSEETFEHFAADEGAPVDSESDGFAEGAFDDTEDPALDGAQISDVIGESEIYIAYGRYPQAVNLLTGALAQDPDRHDVRCKLLELYAETNDAEAFESEYSSLAERCDDADVLTAAAELRGRLEQGEAVALDDLEPEPESQEPAPDDAGIDYEDPSVGPTMDLSEAGLDDNDAAEALEAGADSGDFELEIDGLDPAEPSGDDFELDLNLDGDEPAKELLPDQNLQDGSGDQLGGDLGLNFDPDRDVDTGVFDTAATDTAAEAEAVDADLDLDALLADDDAPTSAEGDDEFDFADPADGTSTKLDLAKAYIDMGDQDGARDILNEVLTEGSEAQQRQAQELLETI